MTKALNSRPKIAILGNSAQKVHDAFQWVRPVLEQHADIVVEDFQSQSDLSECGAKLAVVFGGDGSILRAARQMGDHQIPVLGVNLGKLGFLADLSMEKLTTIFGDIIAGEYRIVEHLMFRCSILRDGQVLHQQLGLNETSILNGPPFSIVDIDLYVDAEMVTSYSCDGLIISTPVGSTAHSLSAGGPILRKDIQAFVISAISPHTLTVRPVVDSANRIYEMQVRDPAKSIAAVVDGEPIHFMQPHDRVRVEKADQTFKLIEVPGRGYYRTLREKLGWGGRLKATNH